MMKLCLNLDATTHPLTLGGALTVRQEGEILAREQQVKEVCVRFSDNIEKGYRDIIWASVFRNAVTEFVDADNIESDVIYWPTPEQLEDVEFSFHSFSRVSYLCEMYNVLPRLQWNKKFLRTALRKIPRTKKVIGLHLKNVHPYCPEDSNAVWDVWRSFLKKALVSYSNIQFVIFGDDEIELDLDAFHNVAAAKDMSLTLSEQLAIIGELSGFLGLASGICTAANFSQVPHVIIKHPNHHSKEIAQELGTGEMFPFSMKSQVLWRKVQTTDLLEEAVKFIMRSYEIKE